MLFKANLFVKKSFLIIFSIILMIIPLFTTTAMAAPTTTENTDVLVIFKPEVDPRVVAQGSSVRAEFLHLETGNSYFILLTHYNNYCEKLYFPKGEYEMISGDVSNDYFAKYPVRMNSHFYARGHSINVSFTVGDPNYKGPVETNNNNLEGEIDYSRTNEELIEGGKEPIHSEYIGEHMDPFNTDPDNPYLSSVVESNVPTTTPETPTEDINNETDSTSEIITDENGNVVENEENEENERTPEQKKRSSIITIIVFIIVIVVVLYLRYKKGDVFVPEDEEGV